MCKFCDVKKGDAKLLDSCTITDGKVHDDAQILTLSIDRTNDVYGLVANCVFDEERVGMSAEKIINFCPICGRYLTRHD